MEFIGSMGAGKSTLCAEVFRRVRVSYPERVRFISELKKDIAAQSIREESVLKWLVFRSLAALPNAFFGIARNRVKLAVNRRTRHDWIMTDEDTTRWGKLIDLVLHGRSSYRGNVFHSLKRVEWFSEMIFCAESESRYIERDLVLSDEGLLHKGVALALGLADQDDFLRKYCDSLPSYPVLIFHVVTDRKVTVDRLSGRSGNWMGHVEWFDLAADLSQKVADQAQANGTKIVNLDGAADVGVNADHCINWMHRVAKGNTIFLRDECF